MTSESLLVLGGARSGKSRYAQHRAEALTGRHVYIATAEAHDDEMCARIARHRADRDARWQTVEAPRDLAAAIDGFSGGGAVLLVDCLTLWASNLLLASADMANADMADAYIERETSALAAVLARFDGHVILVANEVGMGIVPDNVLARRFRDVAGRLNQMVAATVGEVVLVAAGLSLRMK